MDQCAVVGAKTVTLTTKIIIMNGMLLVLGAACNIFRKAYKIHLSLPSLVPGPPSRYLTNSEQLPLYIFKRGGHY